jgi:Acetyltransferase (GNAT) domain
MRASSVDEVRDRYAESVHSKSYDKLGDLPASYVRLFEVSGRRSFFLGLPWFQHIASHILKGSETTRIFAVESADGEPLIVLPMRYIPENGIAQGHRLWSLTNYYSSLFSPVISEECPNVEQAMGALARSFDAQGRQWDVIGLNPLPYDEPEFRILADALADAGMRVQEYFCFGNWYLRVNGRSYREYLKSLPSVTQHTVQRKTKRFEKSGRGRIEIFTGLTGLEAAIDAYDQVYRRSWKEPEPFPQFVPHLMRLCAAKGWLRLGLVYIDGQPAAAQFWLVTGGTASIYKLAYDDRFSELSVGSILTSKLMEYVLDVDRVAEVDYLTGDDPYKRQWMSHRRERWGLIAFNPRTMRGRLGIARHIGGRAVKGAYRSLKRVLRGDRVKIHDSNLLQS